MATRQKTKLSSSVSNIIDFNSKIGMLSRPEEAIVRNEIKQIIKHPQMRKVLLEELDTIGLDKKIDDKQLLSTHAAASLIQMDPSSIVKWVNDKLLPAYLTPGGHRRIRALDLKIFLQEKGMFVPPELRDDTETT